MDDARRVPQYFPVSGHHAAITINGPGHDGTWIRLSEGITSFGRFPSNDVVLVDDLVSRHHARMTFFEGRTTFQDLGSHNGSYVNGQRIDGPHPLAAGDLCRIGPFQVLYREDARDIAPSPPPSSSLLQGIEAARRRPGDQPRAMQVLLRATEALASAPEVGDYIQAMLRLALEQTGAVRGAYLEPGPIGLEIKRVAGPDGPATDARVAPAVVDWAMRKNYPLRVDDLANDLRFEGSPQAVMCVPVPYGDDVLGAVYIARDQPSFVPEDIDTLIAIAHLTGLGIQASRARRVAVGAQLARDALARTFHPAVAADLVQSTPSELRGRQVTVLHLAPDDWPDDVSPTAARTLISDLIQRFCDRVSKQDGRWHIGPGPRLFAVFEDEAGPTRAITVADEVRSDGPSTLRAAVVRGLVLTGITEDGPRLPILAGPGLDAVARLVTRVPAGQVWMNDAAARLYPGPTRSVDDGVYLPT